MSDKNRKDDSELVDEGIDLMADVIEGGIEVAGEAAEVGVEVAGGLLEALGGIFSG